MIPVSVRRQNPDALSQWDAGNHCGRPTLTLRHQGDLWKLVTITSVYTQLGVHDPTITYGNTVSVPHIRYTEAKYMIRKITSVMWFGIDSGAMTAGNAFMDVEAFVLCIPPGTVHTKALILASMGRF